MATCRSLLMVPVTLCFFLLVLPAQSKENLAVVIFYGTARCKSNPSKIISNATLHVTINGTTLATGKTTSMGRFLMAARVTSKDQLSSLVSKKAVITAPRQACGMPAASVAARKLAAQADLNGHRILADNSGDLVDDDDIREIIDLLGDPTVPDPIQRLIDDILSSGETSAGYMDNITVFTDQVPVPEVAAFWNFIENSGLDASVLVDVLNNFVGIPNIERNI
ncbi:hypothetical protein SETIT_6G207900v2 [Setaria italica]|nr:hypothetical protein SETIT_6G207900v2 [Setaria italica]